MLASAASTTNIRRWPTTVRAGFRGDFCDDPEPDFLDWFFGENRRRGALFGEHAGIPEWHL
jgi:hypothetical protein